MALKGTLKDFSLADIFQLIGIQRKTGVLTLHGKEDLVSISFVQGVVVSVESARRRLEDRLATALLIRKLISEEQLAAAVNRQRETLDRIWSILVSQDAVPVDTVKRILQLQVERIIYPVFRWQDGEYSFTQESNVSYDKEYLAPVHSETILMEGVRILDEWPLLERKIRSRELVPRKCPVGGQVICENAPKGEAVSDSDDTIVMDPSDHQVYTLVNGERRVKEILELSDMHDFSTYQALANLMSLGLIALSGERATGSGNPRARGAGGLPGVENGRWRSVESIFAHLLLLVALSLSASTVPQNPLNFLVRDLTDGTRLTRLELARDASQIKQISDLLEVYRLEHGSYPDALDQLTECGLLEEQGLMMKNGSRYYYTGTGSSYSLSIRPDTEGL